MPSPRSWDPTGSAPTWSTPGDVAELVAAVAALLDDPERRARYGVAGRRRVEELFSWRAAAVATAAAYQEAIADFTRGKPC